MKLTKPLLALFLLQSAVSLSAEDPFAGKTEMNGYHLSDYAHFEQSWRLVTVRYRKDTGEMRFVYANPLAWAQLSKGKKNYPDGAVFAKIGIMTEEDPAFTSSTVPSGAKRVQFMVRDAKKHADTGGWGYALFDSEGKTFPGEPHLASIACAACHKIVESRGGIFSTPFELKVLNSAFNESLASATFTTQAIRELPSAMVARLPKSAAEVRFLNGPLRDALFQGTLDEIRPTLLREALTQGLPAVLLSGDKKQFSAVFEDKLSLRCKAEHGRAMVVVYSDVLSPEPVKSKEFCHTP